MHCAGPALGNAAAIARAGQPDRVAQHPKQRGVGFHIHVIRSSNWAFIPPDRRDHRKRRRTTKKRLQTIKVPAHLLRVAAKLPSKALLLTSVLLIRLPPTRPQRIRLVQTRVRMTPVPKALREPFGTGLRPEPRRGKDYGCCLGSSCSGFMGKIVRLILLLRVSREASVTLPTVPSSPQL